VDNSAGRARVADPSSRFSTAVVRLEQQGYEVGLEPVPDVEGWRLTWFGPAGNPPNAGEPEARFVAESWDSAPRAWRHSESSPTVAA
jgi:hypothetical protein